MGSAERMRHVAELITKTSEPKIIVLSAVSGTTNKLVEIGELLSARSLEMAHLAIEKLFSEYQDLLKELLASNEMREIGEEVINNSFSLMKNYLKYPFGKSKNNELLAQGELLSTGLFNLYLAENGIDAQLISALDFMHLDENGEPSLEDISIKLQKVLENYPEQKLFITQGFICLNSEGDIDNLKRGGSDYTASLIGAALNAEEVEIWTDIDGMHNNDPRIVENTRAVQHLSFDEAAELAYFGAKILHPTSILPAQEREIPVRLKNTMNPEAPGTLIDNTGVTRTVKAVAAKDGITAIKIKSSRMLLAHGFLLKVFQIFDSFKTSIDLITTSEIAVSLTVDDTSHLDDIVLELEKLGSVEVDPEQTIICLVGNFIMENGEVVNNLFNALEKMPVRMISLGGSKNNISVLLPAAYKQQALKQINDVVFGLKVMEIEKD